MKTKSLITVLALLAGGSFGAEEDPKQGERMNPHLSTDEVGNQQIMDRESNPLYESKLLAPVADARDAFAEKTGLTMSLDYTAQFMGLSDSVGVADKGAVSALCFRALNFPGNGS